MIDRRQFPGAGGCVLAGLASASLRQAALAATPASVPGAAEAGARVDALFEVLMHERLRQNPQELTTLGLDKGKYAWAKSKLTDASVHAALEFKKDNAARLKRVRAFDRTALQGHDLANYDTVAYTMETIARTEPFQYGDLTHPYVVSQLTGAYQSVPTFRDKQPPER